jgi:hypothetical protein
MEILMTSAVAGHKWKSSPKKGRKPAKAPKPQKTHENNRPTPQREAMGKFEYKDKTGAFDKHHDMIARLHSEGSLSKAQEDAARAYQEVRAGFVSELGIAPIKDSCDASQGGFDAGDGNPAAKKAHDDMRNRIGRIKWAVLDQEVGKGSDGRPRDLGALRNALSCVAASR